MTADGQGGDPVAGAPSPDPLTALAAVTTVDLNIKLAERPEEQR